MTNQKNRTVKLTFMKLSFFILFFFIVTSGISQTIITGKVTDAKNQPIEGANVYLDGTYDGTITDANGQFSFSTNETGVVSLKISFLSYETFRLTQEVSSLNNLEVKLRDDVNALDTVVISAGTFSAGDNSKVSAL